MTAPSALALDPLTSLIYGFRATQTVYVIAKLGVADKLAGGPLTAPELAAQVNADPRNLQRLLRLAAYFGLVSEVPEGRYSLTPVGEALQREVAGSVRPFALMMGEESYRAWGALLHSVQTGESAFDHVYGRQFFDYLALNPDSQATFDAAMSVGTDELFGRPLADAYDFSKVRRMVDIGGGNGSVSAAILKLHPHVEAVIYDQPQVLPAADVYLAKEGVRERCSLVAGNFFESVPDGADVYVLSNIVHDWDDDRALRILRNCRRAMTPRARALLLETVMPPHGHPSRAAMYDVNMMVLLHGQERSEDEYRSLLASADLELGPIKSLSDRIDLIEAFPLPIGERSVGPSGSRSARRARERG
jgi:ubiquinone/menaquinone biosynthesis C-methylase UbiE